MNIQLTGHHVDVTPALREHLVEKLERVKHHFDHAVEVKAIFSVEKKSANRFFATALKWARLSCRRLARKPICLH